MLCHFILVIPLCCIEVEPIGDFTSLRPTAPQACHAPHARHQLYASVVLSSTTSRFHMIFRYITTRFTFNKIKEIYLHYLHVHIVKNYSSKNAFIVQSTVFAFAFPKTSNPSNFL